MQRFQGRVAIVSGASSGIGEAAARRLAAEGATLVLLAAERDEQDLQRVAEQLRERVPVSTVAADITDPATSERAVDEALRTHGRLDAVVSNAGIPLFSEYFDETVETYDRMIAVNARGMYLLTTTAAKAMRGRGGAIVCTSSVASLTGEEMRVAYNVSKGAVRMLVTSLALELARDNIRVNAVAPGYIQTRFTDARAAVPSHWNKARSRIPMDRRGTADEVANAIAFLLSDEASFMYGSTIVIDGGQSAGYRLSDWEAAERDLTPRPRRRLTDA